MKNLFSRKPTSIQDFEKEINKLNNKKRLSDRSKSKLEAYENKLSSMKKEAAKQEQKKKKTIAGSICGLVLIVALSLFMGTGGEDIKSDQAIPATSYNVSDVSDSDIHLFGTGDEDSDISDSNSQDPTAQGALTASASKPASLDSLPAYSGSPFAVINNNIPYFTDEDQTEVSYEYYSELDKLGRCGTAAACVGTDLMPTEKRTAINRVKPSGWHTVKYDCVDGKYLYNRCHLIGYQLSGENANEKNLITGTRYMNTEGMLPFENMVADYVKETGNHVLYRVTPIFEGSDLVSRGVEMEAYSVEDDGEGICFNVFVYNVQPDISIDYSTGNSSYTGVYTSTTSNSASNDASNTASNSAYNTASNAAGTSESKTGKGSPEADSVTDKTVTYIMNTNTKKFHYPSCSSVKQMSESNKETFSGSRDELINGGYEPCKNCNP